MNYLSVCSGIEAATQAWHPLGWKPVAFSEIEAFPAAVLRHHYPTVPNWGDMTKFQEWPDANVSLLVGGTPCQSFSVAGLRKGLADPRGNLALTYLAIADRHRPRWVCWENVPGVLSSNGGRDFGAFLGGLGQLGYGFAYRVLDAQFVRTRRFSRAVPQRRRRVFVVGYLGDWRPAAAVLFDGESLRGNTAPRRQAGERPAPTISARPTGGGGLGTDFDCDGGLVLSHDPACTLTARERKGALPEADLSTVVAHALRGEGFDASEDGTGRGTPLVPVASPWQQGGSLGFSVSEGNCGTLVKNQTQAVAIPNGGEDACTQEAHANQTLRTLREQVGEEAFAEWQSGILDSLQQPEVLRSWLHGESLRRKAGDPDPQLVNGALPRAPGVSTGALRMLWERGPDGRSPQGRELAKQLAQQLGAALPVLPHQSASWAVRRLTPVEAERLQGFPDNFTRIPYRNKPAELCPDGPRYKALGNSMAVNVMDWIGRRISHVEALKAEAAA